MKEEKQKLPNFVFIFGLTIITIIFWITHSVVGLIRKEPTVEVPEEVLKPINPNLDTQTLDRIDKRFFLERNEIQEFEISEESRVFSSEGIVEIEKTPEPTSSPAAPFNDDQT